MASCASRFCEVVCPRRRWRREADMELLHGKDAPSGHHRVLTTDEDESPRAEAVAFPHSPMMDHGTPETSPTSASTSNDMNVPLITESSSRSHRGGFFRNKERSRERERARDNGGGGG
eukprot:CAMPEP_0119541518 /NCGR_PEP_ID=MMETSP1344-20130328/53006_1 /TAXON_ID=236787 /ORGANISM="Florenciella parvula, Strain CCMP2471" /LENGTH=117 /DNA_ID=CAMNT_0007585507 /DNA_START=157 /DNA_END=506 /DNA_ORIENTATION=-